MPINVWSGVKRYFYKIRYHFITNLYYIFNFETFTVTTSLRPMKWMRKIMRYGYCKNKCGRIYSCIVFGYGLMILELFLRLQKLCSFLYSITRRKFIDNQTAR